MTRRQIQLEDSQTEALKALARSRGASIAELVREAVDLLLQARQGRSTADRRRRALAAVGRFRSGKRSVSREHDAELAEAYRK